MPRRLFAALIVLAAPLLAAPASADPDPRDWPAVLVEARGQTVWWHAWGGDARINAYIAWAGAEVARRHGVEVRHVKLSDTAEAVARVAAEKAAGRDAGGAVDLIWINGENFAAMKSAGLLFGPWAGALPHARLLDPEAEPVLASDFTVPTEGLEAPWSLARFVFYHDSARLPAPPRGVAALADWLAANPGRFAYPQPPDYMGSTFLKQALLELAPDRSVLALPAEDAAYAAATAPLWDWLDRLTPNLWRGGAAYPPNGPRLRQLMADGEVDLAFAFDPAEAASAVAAGELPDTVRAYAPAAGGLANASFLAIPFNAAHKAGALVLADFLTSPEAQARKQDPAVWGAATVLAHDRLDPADRARFDALDLGAATPTADALGAPLPEPHPSWMVRIEADWTRRYGAGR